MPVLSGILYAVGRKSQPKSVVIQLLRCVVVASAIFATLFEFCALLFGSRQVSAKVSRHSIAAPAFL